MKIRTSDLTDIALDRAVAKCEGKKVGYEFTLFSPVVIVGLDPYEPSEDWAQGGPIIERENIRISAMQRRDWYAEAWGLPIRIYGPTPLIAAMRCYVASKLGDEIDVPNELL